MPVAAVLYAGDEVNASSKYVEIRLGAMDPWGTGLGFQGGLTGGFRIDQVVSLNLNFDYYRANYITFVQESSSSGSINQTQISSQTTANLYLLFINARVDIPYMIADFIQPYAQFGIGYDLLYNTYQTTSGNQTDLFAGDFIAFQLEVGAQASLGEKTYVFLTIGYDFSSVEKSPNPSDTLAVAENINVGGFSVLIGIGFKL
jgi:opacity protein-like surface antigen